MREPFVVSVILNTNRRDDTLECLESLFRSRYTNHQVVVLDNQSTDGSAAAIGEKYPQARVVALQENLGYAGNNNVGIQIALDMGADWVFVLNEDTLLDPECLPCLLEAGESDPKIGIVGPMVYHFDEPQYIQSGGGRLGPHWESLHIAKDELDRGQLKQNHDVQWISGCAILARRAAIEQAGMIDAAFFYFWEETEWCLRTGKAGWRIVHVPGAKLWHKGVQRNYHPKPSLFYYGTRNRLLMMRKHRAPARAWFGAGFDITRNLLSWSLRPKWRHKKADRDAMWQGLLDFLRGRWGKQGV